MAGKYRAYAEYRDSEVESLGKIPGHWKTASLSKLFSIKAGGDVNLECFSEGRTEEFPYPVYTNANSESAVYGYTSRSNFGPNTITVSGRGYIGFAAFRDHPYDAIIRLLVLAPFGQLHCKFFVYYINEVINFSVQSSAIGQLSTEQISPYKVAFPAVDEQIKIANFLDHETAKIDTLIEKQQQLIKLLQEKRQAVISHAVTKGLNPNAPMRDSGVEWLGEVPEHWRLLKGGYLGYFFGSEPVSEEDVNSDGGIPFLKVSTLSLNGVRPEGYDFFVNELIGKKFRKNKDYLVFPKRGAAIFTNKVNIIHDDSIVDPNLMGWKIGSVARLEFVAHLLKLRGLGDIADVSTVPQINNKHIEPIKFPIPPINEQEEIIEYLEEKSQRFDDLIGRAALAIELMQERRTALISAAVTGKIDVRDWQPPVDSRLRGNDGVAA